MSRSEFLGASAMAAAGVAAGCTGMAGPSVAPQVPQQECSTTCGHGADLEWAIPAGVLNILWGDILPRLVAREWRTTGSTYLQVGMNSARLQTEVQRFYNTVWSSTSTASSVLKDRVQIARDYFSSGRGVVPFRIPGTGGFDFLLSDWGLEFFPPVLPNSSEDRRSALLRYFSFRRTGRPALGLPFYLTDPNSAISTDSPTGPCQIQRDDIVATLALYADCEAKACIARKLERDRNAGSSDVSLGAAASVASRQEVVNLPGYSLEEYKCIMSGLRCWQVEGAAYRAIATEAPRIVAGAWIEKDHLERFNKAATTNITYINRQDSYARRFANPSDSGLRQCFEERLEVMLPRYAKMQFEAVRLPVPPPPALPPDRPAWVPSNWTWNKDDIMITNRGFFFPELPELPTLDGLLEQIEQGKAGNPVFTDSKRTMQ